MLQSLGHMETWSLESGVIHDFEGMVEAVAVSLPTKDVGWQCWARGSELMEFQENQVGEAWPGCGVTRDTRQG